MSVVALRRAPSARPIKLGNCDRKEPSGASLLPRCPPRRPFFSFPDLPVPFRLQPSPSPSPSPKKKRSSARPHPLSFSPVLCIQGSGHGFFRKGEGSGHGFFRKGEGSGHGYINTSGSCHPFKTITQSSDSNTPNIAASLAACLERNGGRCDGRRHRHRQTHHLQRLLSSELRHSTSSSFIHHPATTSAAAAASSVHQPKNLDAVIQGALPGGQLESEKPRPGDAERWGEAAIPALGVHSRDVPPPLPPHVVVQIQHAEAHLPPSLPCSSNSLVTKVNPSKSTSSASVGSLKTDRDGEERLEQPEKEVVRKETAHTHTDAAAETALKLKQWEMELATKEHALEEDALKARNERHRQSLNRHLTMIEMATHTENLKYREHLLEGREHHLAVLEEKAWQGRKDAELNKRERGLNLREDALTDPLLADQQKSHTNHTKLEDNMWNKRQIYLTIAMVTGLTVLIQMQPQFLAAILPCIVGAFATAWVLTAIAFPCGLFGTSRLEKDYSRHVGRLAFMLFSLFILYVPYILSVSLKQSTTSSSVPPVTPSSSLPPVTPPALAPTPSSLPPVTLSWRSYFYIGLGGITMLVHIALWIAGCATGGDRDLGP